MRVFAKKKLVYKSPWSTSVVQLWVCTYDNGRVGLQLMSRGDYAELGPYMTASVNLVDEACPSNEVFIKNYSENEGIVDHLIEWGVIEPKPTGMAISGYVTINRYRFIAGFMMELANAFTSGKKVKHG